MPIACWKMIVSVAFAPALILHPSFGLQDLPRWSPKEHHVENLGVELPLGRHSLRVPKGFSQTRANKLSAKLPGSTIRILIGPMRADKSAASLVLVSDLDRSHFTLERAMLNVLAGTRNSLERSGNQEWKHTPPQKGMIGPIKFIRASYSCFMPANEKRLRGITYVAHDLGLSLILSGADIDPYDKNTIAVSEAAIQTIRRK